MWKWCQWWDAAMGDDLTSWRLARRTHAWRTAGNEGGVKASRRCARRLGCGREAWRCSARHVTSTRATEGLWQGQRRRACKGGRQDDNSSYKPHPLGSLVVPCDRRRLGRMYRIPREQQPSNLTDGDPRSLGTLSPSSTQILLDSSDNSPNPVNHQPAESGLCPSATSSNQKQTRMQLGANEHTLSNRNPNSQRTRTHSSEKSILTSDCNVSVKNE
ncbi:hypothetical protein GGR57DRAFT_473382 [Xylariaceae sp. FL1272]|nr:hypothetical protein GGR57DRAFT_473382 [Xylariaceae sp. FL1272]